MGWRRWIAIGGTVLVTGCTTYEYEEEVFLAVDGSGRIRVSGSEEMLAALHVDPAHPVTTATIAELFQGPGVEIDSVRETERRGRRFLHVQGRFDEWNHLCALPAFADRDCRLEMSDEELALYLTLPAPERGIPDRVPADAVLALRFHFPSSVRYHNSPRGIERGNIIEWERSPAELIDESELRVEARFERRSVLASTLVVLGTAFGIVAGAVGLALWLMVRKGRRQLALEGDSARTSTVQGQ